MVVYRFKYTSQYLPTEDYFNREVYAATPEGFRSILNDWDQSSALWRYFESAEDKDKNERNYKLGRVDTADLPDGTDYYDSRGIRYRTNYNRNMPIY